MIFASDFHLIQAILAYRVFRDVKKIRVKILHASLLALSFIFSAIGLKAVFDNHNYAVPPRENLYSLHSWLGILTVIFFAFQWIGGFITFLFPKLSEEIRRNYMPTSVENETILKNERFFFKFLVTNFGAKRFFLWLSVRFWWELRNTVFCKFNWKEIHLKIFIESSVRTFTKIRINIREIWWISSVYSSSCSQRLFFIWLEIRVINGHQKTKLNTFHYPNDEKINFIWNLYLSSMLFCLLSFE